MKKYLCILLLLSSCHKKPTESHLISLQMLDRNGQTETISQSHRVKLLEKQNFNQPQPYEKILRVFSKTEEGKNPSILTTYHKNGQLFQHLEAMDGRANGHYDEYYETGQIRIKASVIEGTADLTTLAQQSWVFDGPCQIFYPSGSLQASFIYDRGKKEGDAVYYYQEGPIHKKLYFINDLADGEIIEYYKDGQFFQSYTFKNGQQDGYATKYLPYGKIAYKEFWEKDFLLEATYFNSQEEKVSEIINGSGVKTLFEEDRLLTTLEYKDGKLEGKICLFDNKEFLTSSYHIFLNQKHGEEIVYYENSAFEKMRIDWQEDMISGLVKTFYNDGSLESQKSYSQNKKNGPSSIFYPGGHLMMLETYSQDRLIEGKYFKKGDSICSSQVENGTGVVSIFDEWGGIKQEIQYEKGKIVLAED
jgi:antitoxin component YwqK of YwqJK toxin-antitoxin module